MARSTPTTTLFLDIGGVLLTNGWDHLARQRAAEHFGLDYPEMNERHHMTFGTYEVGKVSLDDYLKRVVFNQRRSFGVDEFKRFMFEQSQPLPGMLELFRQLKAEHQLKVAAVSNEGRELNQYRIRQFDLSSLIDTFVSSCFVHFRKPDLDIFRMALDLTHAEPEQVVYIDDREMFVEVAGELGIPGIWHRDRERTLQALSEFGLKLP